MEKKKIIVGSIGIILIILLFSQVTPKQSKMETTTDWQKEYVQAARASLPNYDKYIENTAYYNYNDPKITMVADKLFNESNSAKEFIQKVASYTAKNAPYDISEPDSKCLEGTAPEILESGSGQCDTQTILDIAILRSKGIAVIPMGGCLIRNQNCQLQAFFMEAIGEAPKFKEIEPNASQTTFSRGGGLHAWSEAWLPQENWVVIESTDGTINSGSCFTYHIELVPKTKEDICISKSYNYALACSKSDLDSLDKYGLGVFNQIKIN